MGIIYCVVDYLVDNQKVIEHDYPNYFKPVWRFLLQVGKFSFQKIFIDFFQKWFGFYIKLQKIEWLQKKDVKP